MKQIIPYNLFKDYIVMALEHLQNDDERIEYYKRLEKHILSMQRVLWEDIIKLNKEDLERIPICWLYDWCHITANYEYQATISSFLKNITKIIESFGCIKAIKSNHCNNQ